MEFAPLSPFGMLLNAGLVSKIVMICLLAASVWTWALILDGAYVVWRLSRALRVARAGGELDALWSIAEAELQAGASAPAGERAIDRRRRMAAGMRRAAGGVFGEARAGLASLAIISSVAPFVGLFGTVWGIMSSFVGIAETQETSLTVVAPGISEALAATAYGLAAAIPAAIGYNLIGAALSRLGEGVESFSIERLDGAVPRRF